MNNYVGVVYTAIMIFKRGPENDNEFSSSAADIESPRSACIKKLNISRPIATKPLAPFLLNYPASPNFIVINPEALEFKNAIINPHANISSFPMSREKLQNM